MQHKIFGIFSHIKLFRTKVCSRQCELSVVSLWLVAKLMANRWFINEEIAKPFKETNLNKPALYNVCYCFTYRFRDSYSCCFSYFPILNSALTNANKAKRRFSSRSSIKIIKTCILNDFKFPFSNVFSSLQSEGLTYGKIHLLSICFDLE